MRGFSIARKCFFYVTAIVAFTSVAWSWGGTTHIFINKEAVKHLPPSFPFFANNVTWISNHATDPDTRKNATPGEAPKHFIDIEDYPEFKLGTLPHDINVLNAEYGATAVSNIGVVPWAIIWSLDSLTNSLRRKDSVAALQFAADLGHYVGDAHQPLHVTSNYDGGSTGNNGIHSRYESTMLQNNPYNYLTQISIAAKPVHFIPVPIDTNFAFIGHGNTLVDSILKADTYAKSVSGGAYNSSYYAALWQKTGAMTQNQIQDATVDLACLWYTAAINAGLVSVTSVTNASQLPAKFELLQNYPNPFNPSTTIMFSLGTTAPATVKIYNLLGQELETLSSGTKSTGVYRVEWKPTGLPSGVYLCRLETGGYTQTRKLILMK